MSNRAHKGRCFRSGRETARRKERQGVTARHKGLAEIAVMTGIAKNFQGAMGTPIHMLEWLIGRNIRRLSIQPRNSG